VNADALLAAVCEAPDDDAPRLVYADWLEEHGDAKDQAHAELIRVQIELTRLPLDDDRRAELRAREERVRHKHALVERMGFPRWCGWETVRGFPEMLRHPNQKWQLSEPDLEIMARMVDRLPIRGIAAELTPEGLERITNWPTLARLTCLETTLGFESHSTEVFGPAVSSLAQSANAANLRRLRLGAWQYDARSLHRVATFLPRLTDLQLGRHDREVVFFAFPPVSHLPLGKRLERLDLSWFDVDPYEVREFLLRSPLLELHFGAFPQSEEVVTSIGVGPLLGAAGLSGLRLLDVTGEDHGFDVDELPYPNDHRAVSHLTELLTSSQLAGLEQLSLRGIMLGDDGARALASGPMARNLVRLRLDLCGLTGEGLRALRPLLAEGRIRSLSLEHNVFDDKDARDLASWPELARLHELSLGYFNHVGDDGRKALGESPHRHPHSRYG
jgi:uncharacterized protein (TIGR02996 family)